MTPDWQDAPVPKQRFGPLGWLRVLVRGLAMALLTYAGLLLLLILRLVALVCLSIGFFLAMLTVVFGFDLPPRYALGIPAEQASIPCTPVEFDQAMFPRDPRGLPDGGLDGTPQVVPFEELMSTPVTRLTLGVPPSTSEEFLARTEKIGLHGVE